MQAEDFEEAARLRDKLRSHPENVARHERLRLEAQLQSAVASEDFEVCSHACCRVLLSQLVAVYPAAHMVHACELRFISPWSVAVAFELLLIGTL